MKLLLVGLAAGVLIGATGTAVAAISGLVVVRNGDKVFLKGAPIVCAVESGTIGCGRADLGYVSYTVGVNRYLVTVSKGQRTIFSRRY